MTNEQKEMLKRINDYAEKAMPDIDPQKVQVSKQLEALKPIMQQIADERNIALTDVFVEYMDLASEAAVETDNKLKESLKDLNDGSDGNMPLLYR